MILVSLENAAPFDCMNWSEAHYLVQHSYAGEDDDEERTFSVSLNEFFMVHEKLSFGMFDALFEDPEAMRLYFHAFSGTKVRA